MSVNTDENMMHDIVVEFFARALENKKMTNQIYSCMQERVRELDKENKKLKEELSSLQKKKAA